MPFGREYSYSGSDAKAYIHFDGFGQEVAELTSLQTVSWSVYEAKGPARALGHRSVKGYARGVRTIAGSLILTVIRDNPLRPLLTLAAQAEEAGLWPYHPGWSVDSVSGRMGVASGRGTGTYWGQVNALKDIKLQSKLAALIPPFNLSVVYSTEVLRDDTASYGTSNDLFRHEAAAWRLSGVEFITEGIVTSINDTITEVTAQFVATDAYPMTLNQLEVASGTKVSLLDLDSTTFDQDARELARRLNQTGVV